MIKKIIFDIDNTLINFDVSLIPKYQKVIDKYNLKINFMDLYNAIDEYEKCGKYKYYDEKELLKVINKELNTNLDMNFMNDFFYEYDNMVSDVSSELIDTLDYLSKKYELVIYSNWFTKSQENRLKKANIYKYFTHIYCADKVVMKPYLEGMLEVIGKNKPNECVMVGDSITCDITPAYKLGLNVYYLCSNNKTKYNSIDKIEKLKELL